MHAVAAAAPREPEDAGGDDDGRGDGDRQTPLRVGVSRPFEADVDHVRERAGGEGEDDAEADAEEAEAGETGGEVVAALEDERVGAEVEIAAPAALAPKHFDKAREGEKGVNEQDPKEEADIHGYEYNHRLKHQHLQRAQDGAPEDLSLRLSGAGGERPAQRHRFRLEQRGGVRLWEPEQVRREHPRQDQLHPEAPAPGRGAGDVFCDEAADDWAGHGAEEGCHGEEAKGGAEFVCYTPHAQITSAGGSSEYRNTGRYVRSQMSDIVPPATVSEGEPNMPTKKRQMRRVSVLRAVAQPIWKTQKRSQVGM